jgi:hypothetical protein
MPVTATQSKLQPAGEGFRSSRGRDYVELEREQPFAEARSDRNREPFGCGKRGSGLPAGVVIGFAALFLLMGP